MSALLERLTRIPTNPAIVAILAILAIVADVAIVAVVADVGAAVTHAELLARGRARRGWPAAPAWAASPSRSSGRW
jgi:hypothetical protein